MARRLAWFILTKRDRDAPGDTHFLGMEVRVGHCEPSGRTAPPQCRRTRVLEDEGDAVGAVAQPALARQPELERSVKAGSHVLFLDEPDSSRSIGPGRREPQDLATGNCGITNQSESLSGGKAVEANRSKGRADRAQKECDPDQVTSSCSHTNDYD
jgi:hypothetical protein